MERKRESNRFRKLREKEREREQQITNEEP
jgi:hypothetical protein